MGREGGVCMVVCVWGKERVVCAWGKERMVCAWGERMVCAWGERVCAWEKERVVCAWGEGGVYIVHGERRGWCVHGERRWCVHGERGWCVHGERGWCVHGERGWCVYVHGCVCREGMERKNGKREMCVCVQRVVEGKEESWGGGGEVCTKRKAVTSDTISMSIPPIIQQHGNIPRS